MSALISIKPSIKFTPAGQYVLPASETEMTSAGFWGGQSHTQFILQGTDDPTPDPVAANHAFATYIVTRGGANEIPLTFRNSNHSDPLNAYINTLGHGENIVGNATGGEEMAYWQKDTVFDNHIDTSNGNAPWTGPQQGWLDTIDNLADVTTILYNMFPHGGSQALNQPRQANGSGGIEPLEYTANDIARHGLTGVNPGDVVTQIENYRIRLGVFYEDLKAHRPGDWKLYVFTYPRNTSVNRSKEFQIRVSQALFTNDKPDAVLVAPMCGALLDNVHATAVAKNDWARRIAYMRTTGNHGVELASATYDPNTLKVVLNFNTHPGTNIINPNGSSLPQNIYLGDIGAAALDVNTVTTVGNSLEVILNTAPASDFVRVYTNSADDIGDATNALHDNASIPGVSDGAGMFLKQYYDFSNDLDYLRATVI